MDTHPQPQDTRFADRVRALVALGRTTHPSLASRLQSAEALVLEGLVWRQADGSYYVRSTSHPASGYVLAGWAGECACPDSQHRAAVCKHTLAVGLLRRVTRELGSGDPGDVPTGAAAEVERLRRQARPLTARGLGPQPADWTGRLAAWQLASNQRDWARRAAGGGGMMHQAHHRGTRAPDAPPAAVLTPDEARRLPGARWLYEKGRFVE